MGGELEVDADHLGGVMAKSRNYRARLVRLVQELERLDELKREASAALADQFSLAKAEGYDTTTTNGGQE